MLRRPLRVACGETPERARCTYLRCIAHGEIVGISGAKGRPRSKSDQEWRRGEKKASERASERDDCGEIHQMRDEIDDTTTDLALALSLLFSLASFSWLGLKESNAPSFRYGHA